MTVEIKYPDPTATLSVDGESIGHFGIGKDKKAVFYPHRRFGLTYSDLQIISRELLNFAETYKLET